MGIGMSMIISFYSLFAVIRLIKLHILAFVCFLFVCFSFFFFIFFSGYEC